MAIFAALLFLALEVVFASSVLGFVWWQILLLLLVNNFAVAILRENR